MPVIGKYKGLTIKMYFQQEEHNPPHVHVSCGENSAIIYINNLDDSEGDLKESQMSNAKEWVTDHIDELLNMWNNQIFYYID